MDEKFKEFMSKNGLGYVIGFSGGSDKEENQVQNIIEESMTYLKSKPVVILTGGTKYGVPRIATEIAKDYGLKTIGVMPQRGEKSAVGGLDLVLIAQPRVGSSEYGDESEIFAKLCNGVEIIGGSSGTKIEFNHIMKINDRRLNPKYNETPIYVAPIASISGFSSQIHGSDEARKFPQVIPSEIIMNGKDAAEYLINKLKIIG